jgi:hypothetical protein
MVRSKQTAKKSTGYRAPRVTLLPSRTRIMRSRKAAQIKSTTNQKGRAGSNAEGPSTSITNNVTLRIQLDVPTHVLTVDVRGPINLKADMDKDHDEVRRLFLITLQ